MRDCAGIALGLVALCVASAVAFPQNPYGEAAQLGETKVSQLQAAWSNAAQHYNAKETSAVQGEWASHVQAESPAQMASIAKVATQKPGADLPYHEPMGGKNRKAPKVSLKKVSAQLAGLEAKQVDAAQATLAGDRQKEANDEAKIDSLRMVGTEEKAMENLKLQSDETAYQKSENRVSHDKAAVEKDSMNAMSEKMKVGMPKVEQGQYALPGFPVGQQNIGM